MKIIPLRIKVAALELYDRGVPAKTAATQISRRFRLKISEGAIRNWARKRDAERLALDAEDDAPPSSAVPDLAPLDAPNAPEAPTPPTTVETPEDVYAHTRKQLNDAVARAERASAEGNHTAAQRFGRDIVQYTLLIARLDKERKASADGVTFTRDELEAARRTITSRVEALASDLARTGGIVCSQCGREIRTAIAKGE